MNENDLREALAAIAGDPPAAAPKLPAELARRARRRRTPPLLAGVAALVAAAVGLAALVGGGSSVDTRPASGPPPPELVATTLSGAVVVVSSADGSILRTLAPDTSATGSPARSPDGRWVYYGGRPTADPCFGPLYRVPAKGGAPPEPIAQGGVPAVSPDGARLAYVTSGRSGCVGALVVRTLATGEERSWPAPEPGRSFLALGVPDAVRWAPDGRRVAFSLGYQDGAVYVLDTERPGALEDAQRIEGKFHAPSWRPDGRLVALRTVEEEVQDGRDRVREQVVVVDPATEEVSPVVYAAVDATALDVDPSGGFLVVVNKRGDLFLRAGDGPLRRLDGGFRTASW